MRPRPTPWLASESYGTGLPLLLPGDSSSLPAWCAKPRGLLASGVRHPCGRTPLLSSSPELPSEALLARSRLLSHDRQIDQGAGATIVAVTLVAVSLNSCY